MFNPVSVCVLGNTAFLRISPLFNKDGEEAGARNPNLEGKSVGWCSLWWTFFTLHMLLLLFWGVFVVCFVFKCRSTSFTGKQNISQSQEQSGKSSQMTSSEWSKTHESYLAYCCHQNSCQGTCLKKGSSNFPPNLRDMDSISGWGSKILHVAWLGQKINRV